MYVTGDRAEVVVCELCRPRAEAAGWLKPEEAALIATSSPRERRRTRGQMLSGLLARLPASRPDQAESGEPEEAAERPGRAEPEAEQPPRQRRRPPREPRRQRQPRPRREEAEPQGEPKPAEEAPAPRAERAPAAPPEEPAAASPGTTLPEAVAAFNASDHRRTVRGLTRTLGLPRASGLAIRTSAGHPGARLTVAWELTWYQWEVGPGPNGPEVRESGKGETIDQLRAADRTWNLLADADGTLEQKKSAAGGSESGS